MTTDGGVLQANLERVFSERDAGRRREAIQELYASDAVLYEQEAQYAGRQAIEDAVTKLLASLPPGLVFAVTAPAMQNHDIGKLLWKGQLPDGTTIVTGTDVARIVGGRIHGLYVFIDPQNDSGATR